MNSKKFVVKIFENWPIKVLSIALALFLFMFYRLNTMTSRSLSVPLLIETGAVLVPASVYPQNVRVTLRGEDDGIKSIADTDIEAYVDLMRYESEGVYSAPVQIRKKGIALTIEPLEAAVYPLKVTIQLDRKISKTLPLEAVIRGRVADGYDLTSHSITPAEVVVSGPLASIESLSEMKTEPVDLDGRTSSFTVEVNISSPSSLFEISGSATAEFSGFIQPTVSVRSIDSIPIVLIGLDPYLEADTGGRMGSVRIEGGQGQLDAFEPPPHFFAVDCSGLSAPGTYTLPVDVDLPRSFSLLRRDPEELSLTVTLRENFF